MRPERFERPTLIEKSLKLRTFASVGVLNPRLKWRAAKRPCMLHFEWVLPIQKPLPEQARKRP